MGLGSFGFAIETRSKAVVLAFSIDDGEVHVQRPNPFGFEIEDAIIMRAKRAG